MTVAPSSPAPAPPKGYRPKLSTRDKLRAALHALGLTEETVEWDHDPPIQMRVWVPEKGDTDPPARDPRHVVPRPTAEHLVKTAGRATKARAEGDVTEIARTKRLADEQEEFRRRVLAKEPGKPRERKSKIQGRPLRGGNSFRRREA